MEYHKHASWSYISSPINSSFLFQGSILDLVIECLINNFSENHTRTMVLVVLSLTCLHRLCFLSHAIISRALFKIQRVYLFWVSQAYALLFFRICYNVTRTYGCPFTL